jgi:DNA-binding NtrC family response regulator
MTMSDAVSGASLTRAVLVVDDEMDLARGMVALLKRRGLEAQAIGDPQEALELVRADPKRWGAVLTDMTMPFMSGREFRRHLRAIHPELPVLLMSGMEDDVEPGEFEGRLVKPFKVDDLLPLLRPFLA